MKGVKTSTRMCWRIRTSSLLKFFLESYIFWVNLALKILKAKFLALSPLVDLSSCDIRTVLACSSLLGHLSHYGKQKRVDFTKLPWAICQSEAALHPPGAWHNFSWLFFFYPLKASKCKCFPCVADLYNPNRRCSLSPSRPARCIRWPSWVGKCQTPTYLTLHRDGSQ